jgi:hypothetical protein
VLLIWKMTVSWDEDESGQVNEINQHLMNAYNVLGNILGSGPPPTQGTLPANTCSPWLH